jgi:Zn-dependent protease
MGGGRWKIATIRGIPLYVGSSVLFLAAFYIYGQYFSLTQGLRLGTGEALTLSVLTAVLFFGSVLLHEAAHAAMARALDMPVSGITLVFWGGATEIRASVRGPLGEFLVAFVGPATTLALSGAFWVAARVAHGTVADILQWLSFISLVFAGLNTLPGFPLDGGRMFLAIVWGVTKDRRTGLRAAGYMGIVVGIAILAAAVWRITSGDDLFISGDDLFIAIFLGYIGFMILTTGRGMEQRIAFRDQLVKGTAAEAMRPPPQAVPAEMSLTQALDHYLRGTDGESFPVTDQGRVIGTVSMASAKRVGGRNPMRPVRDATLPLNQTPVVTPDETLDNVLEWLGGRDGLVLREGMLAGAIGPLDVERWYRRVIEGKSEIAGATPKAGGIPPRPDL